MLYCVAPCCIVLRHGVLCCAMVYCVAPCCAVVILLQLQDSGLPPALKGAGDGATVKQLQVKLSVSPDSSIADLKEQIERATGIKVDRQKFHTASHADVSGSADCATAGLASARAIERGH